MVSYWNSRSSPTPTHAGSSAGKPAGAHMPGSAWTRSTRPCKTGVRGEMVASPATTPSSAASKCRSSTPSPSPRPAQADDGRYDNALSVNHQRPPQGGGDPTVLAVAELRSGRVHHTQGMHWFSHRRLLVLIGNIPPPEAGEQFYAAWTDRYGGVTHIQRPPPPRRGPRRLSKRRTAGTHTELDPVSSTL